MKKLAIIAVSIMTAFTGVLPAQAFPVANATKIEAPQSAPEVQQVQYRDYDRRWDGRRRHWDRDRYDGYRGRHYRRHHRGSNAGAIIGGLAAGAIIGGALAQPRYVAPQRRYVSGNSHVQYCYSRYRSYRAYDNTFQPNYGPRRQCVSPY